MYASSQEISIEQAIIRNPLTISANATIAEAIALMSANSQTCHLSCEVDSETSLQLAHAQNSCILVTEEKKLIGILTERDLIKFCGQHSDRSDNQGDTKKSLGQNLIETAIIEVMAYPVYALLEWEFTDILVPINRFHRYKIRHLPLVNNQGEVVGLLTHESLRQLLRPVDMLRLRLVSEVLVTQVVHAQPTDSVTKIANLMASHNVSSVVIAESRDEGLFPLGIITEGDIVQYLGLELDLAIPSQIVMSCPVTSVGLNETLWSVREIMQERMINHLIVIGANGQMEGIVSQSDLLKTLQPTEIYKLVSSLENKMSRLEQEKLELLQSRNKLLESQVQESNAALIDGNNIFHQFAEHNRGVIVICEISSGKCLYVSPAYAEIWGKSCESLYEDPTSWMVSVHPEDSDRVIQGYQLKVKTGFFSEEYRIIRPNGEIRWVWGRCFPIKNAYGEIYRIVAIIEDISDRKYAEIALKESEQRLRASEAIFSAMFNRAYVGMTINDLDGKFVMANSCYQEMVGYSESELKSMVILDNTVPEDIPEHLRLRNLILSGKGESYQMEKRLIHRDGHIIWVRTTSSLIWDDEGNQKLIFGLIENITDLKQSEASLQSLVEGTAAQTGENFLPALAEYIAKALEVRHVFVTERMGDLLNLKVAWMDGQLQPSSVISMINAPCAMTISAGRYFCSERLQDNFMGNEIIKSLEADSYLGIAIVNSKSEILGSLCIFDDKPISNLRRADAMLRVFAARVSAEIERQKATDELYQLNQELELRVEQRTEELKLANHQLIETNRELARATRLKDEFLANMSHELRTPLNAILGMSEGLLDRVFGDVNERQQRSLDLIQSSGQHLLELINDILDVAKIGSGQFNLEINPVKIEYICQSSLNFVKQIAKQKNIQLKLVIPPNMNVMVAVDERRMRQALINLLSNAVKFTPNGGKVCLEVKLQEISHPKLTANPDFPYALTFSITDTGIGISPQDMDKLFQTFVQIDSSLSRQYTGTGLGLTLVKQIAELHGGWVEVTSQVGKGSCFSILLPHAA